MTSVANEFERFARENYPPRLRDARADHISLLAGLRYVQTRRVTGDPAALHEVFTTRRRGELAREVDRACLDALVDCTTNAMATARLLADVGTRRIPLPTTDLCREGLERLGDAGVVALLDGLAVEPDGLRRRRLALLLSRVSRARMPEPMPFWGRAEPEERAEVLQRWRAELIGADEFEDDLAVAAAEPAGVDAATVVVDEAEIAAASGGGTASAGRSASSD